MRLIDAEAMDDKLETLMIRCRALVNKRLEKDYKFVRTVLGEAPTVDAVPVVHGRWIWNDENQCWICSNCEMSALNNYRGNSTDSNYCPSCGAKMDGNQECNL